MYLTTERPPGYSLIMPTWGSKSQSNRKDSTSNRKLDPTLPVELVDPVTTSSTSTSPLHGLDDSIAKKVISYTIGSKRLKEEGGAASYKMIDITSSERQIILNNHTVMSLSHRPPNSCPEQH